VDGRTLDIDSRPSDAIALAVRAHVPILVARPILDSVGVIPEEDLKESTNREDTKTELVPSDIDEGDLSVFEDFLENLEIDDEDEGDQDADDEAKKPS
jgi:uncharacterized protein